MEYTKTVWKDLPDTSTPITADKLNNLEDGVEYLFENGTGGGGDNLPVGTEVDFDGTSQQIPTGWQEITNPDSYSTSEVKTNKTWISGESIYRKAFYFTQWSGLGLDTNLENIDNIINASVMLKNTASSQWMKLACNPDGSYGFYIKKTGNTYKIFISNESVYTADAICSFIEYTKTTD